MRKNSLRRTSIRDRVHHCTHIHLTRIYDADTDNLRCMICHQKPTFGWLYRCTQDSNGFLPASDFYPHVEPQKSLSDVHLYTLNESIMAAARQGHYTDEELDVLWKQKIGVRKVIQQLRPTSSSSASSSLSSSQLSFPTSTTSSTLGSSVHDTETDTDISQLSDYSLPCRAPLEPIQEVHDDLERDPKMLSIAPPVLPPPCEFRICHGCRPVYRERAWASLDHVVKSPFKAPPEHEFSNRLVSDANIVRRLTVTAEAAAALDPCQSLQAQNQRFSRLSFKETVQKLLRECDEPLKSEQDEQPTLRHIQTCNDLAALARVNSREEPSALIGTQESKSISSKTDSL